MDRLGASCYWALSNLAKAMELEVVPHSQETPGKPTRVPSLLVYNVRAPVSGPRGPFWQETGSLFQGGQGSGRRPSHKGKSRPGSARGCHPVEEMGSASAKP